VASGKNPFDVSSQVSLNDVKQMIAQMRQGPVQVQAGNKISAIDAMAKLNPEAIQENGSQLSVNKFAAKISGKKGETAKQGKDVSTVDSLGKNENEDNVLSFMRKEQRPNMAGMNQYKKASSEQDAKLIRQSGGQEGKADIVALNQSHNAKLNSSMVADSTGQQSLNPKISVKNSQMIQGVQAPRDQQSQVIKQISDYLIQTSVKNDNSEMTIKHQDLGDIHVKVSKLEQPGEIAIRIATQGQEAHGVIREQEGTLLKNLSDAGFKVGDFKLTQASNQMSGDMKQDFGSQRESGTRQNSSFDQFGQSGQQRQERAQDDSQRRRALWDMYREQVVA
jgi:hypothetical protein